MKSFDTNYLLLIADKANEILEQKRQRQLKGASPSLVPDKPVRMCLAEVEAVLTALEKWNKIDNQFRSTHQDGENYFLN